ALGEAVSGCLSSGLGCIAADPREGYAGDRAFIALLQGDRDGAIGQNNTVLLGETVPFVPVGMRLTTGLLDDVPSGASAQARRFGDNGSYYAEGNFDGKNPSDSIYQEARLQANRDYLMGQSPFHVLPTGAYTQDNAHVDYKFYEDLKRTDEQ